MVIPSADDKVVEGYTADLVEDDYTFDGAKTLIWGPATEITEQDNFYEVAVLDKKKVVYGNLVDLRKSYEIAATQMKPVKISDSEIIPFNGWVEYQVVKDGLELVGRLYPPVIGMNEVTEREVESDLISDMPEKVADTTISDRDFGEIMNILNRSKAKRY